MAIVVLGSAVLVVTQSACGGSGRTDATAARGDAQHGIGTEPPQTQRITIDPAAGHAIIARVGRHAISRGYLEQWTELETVIASQYRHASYLPTGFVPDPPAYRRCIAYLAATATRIPSPGPAQLKLQCEQEREKQELSTLSHLLRDAFSYEEAARRGVRLDTAEVRRETASRGVKSSLLMALGVPPAYQEFQIGAELLTKQLAKTLPVYRRMLKAGHETLKMADEVDNEAMRFYAEMVRRWSARTYCDPEFVVPVCSDYSQESPL